MSEFLGGRGKCLFFHAAAITWAKPVSKLLFGFTLTYMEEPKKYIKAENDISPTGMPKPTTHPALTWMYTINITETITEIPTET